MATIPSYFTNFLANIRLTDTQKEECKTGHSTLRERLHKDEYLKDIIVDSFLQGSYKRATAVRPFADKKKTDVDIIVVTTLDRNEFTPRQALNIFKPFLETYYKGKYKAQEKIRGQPQIKTSGQFIVATVCFWKIKGYSSALF